MGSLPFGKDMLKKTKNNNKDRGNNQELTNFKDMLKPTKKNEKTIKENKIDYNLKHVEKPEAQVAPVAEKEPKDRPALKHIQEPQKTAENQGAADDEKDEGTRLTIKLRYNGLKKKTYVIAEPTL